MKLIKPSNIWLEIEYTEDRELMELRIEKLNQFCKRAGVFVDGYDQRFSYWEHPKRKTPGLAYFKGRSSGFEAGPDFGQWFNLDYLADPENFSFDDYDYS